MMILIGLPLYVCATASIPIALAMMGKGITLGAALVFLMVGPATNTTSITTMINILGRRATIINILSLIFISLFFGVLVDSLSITVPNLENIHLHEHTSIINTISAFVIIGLAINTLAPSIFLKSNISHDLSFKISGMTCQGCVKKIKKSLVEMDIEEINIDLDSSIASMKTHLSKKKIKSTIERLGFTVID